MENKKIIVDKELNYTIKGPHKNINVLMLALSTFAKNNVKKKDEEKDDLKSFPYKVDEGSIFTFYGESYIGRYQLDPVPKILSKMLNDKGERLDYIIAFCTTNKNSSGELELPMVEKETDVLLPIEGGTENKDYAPFRMSPMEYFKTQIALYMPQDGEERVIPIRIAEEDPASGIEKAINEIRRLNKCGEVHLHLDSHGGFRDIALTWQAIISLLGKGEIIVDHSFSVKYGKNIVSLDQSMEMFDFASGINEFTNYGRLSSLKEFIEKRSMNNVPEIERLMNILQGISDSICICDTSKFEEGLLKLTDYYETVGVTSKLDYLAVFTDTIKNDFGVLLTDQRTVIDEIRWCLRKEYYQQALTLIENRMPGEFVRNGLRYYYNQNRQIMVQVFNEFYSEVNDYEKYKVENPAHFFIKYYHSMKKGGKHIKKIIKDNHNAANYCLQKKSLFDDTQSISDLIGNKSTPGTYFWLCDKRNEINHGEKVEIAVSDLKNAIEEFLRNYEAILRSPHGNQIITEVKFDESSKTFVL